MANPVIGTTFVLNIDPTLKTLKELERATSSTTDKISKTAIKMARMQTKALQELAKGVDDPARVERLMKRINTAQGHIKKAGNDMVKDMKSVQQASFSSMERQIDNIIRKAAEMYKRTGNATGSMSYATARIGSLDSVKRYNDSLKQVEKQSKVTADAVSKNMNGMKVPSRFVAELQDIRNAFLGISSLHFGKQMLDYAVQFESLNASFEALTGSIKGANQVMDYLDKNSKELGVNILSSAKDFRVLIGASMGSNIAMGQLKETFTAVSKASMVLGMSAEDTTGIMRAFGQMISKGKVQAEELKGQIGDRLPGAIEKASRAMNVSTYELFKMMEKGELFTDEFIPKFTKVIENDFAKGVDKMQDSTRVALNKMANAWINANVAIAEESGFLTGAKELAKALEYLGTSIETNRETLRTYIELIGKLGLAYGAFKIWKMIDGTKQLRDGFALLSVAIQSANDKLSSLNSSQQISTVRTASQVQAMSRLEVSVGRVKGAFVSLGDFLRTNWIGIGLSVALMAISEFSSSAKDDLNSISELIDSMSEKALKKQKESIEKQIEMRKKAITAIYKEQAKLVGKDGLQAVGMREQEALRTDKELKALLEILEKINEQQKINKDLKDAPSREARTQKEFEFAELMRSLQISTLEDTEQEIAKINKKYDDAKKKAQDILSEQTLKKDKEHYQKQLQLIEEYRKAELSQVGKKKELQLQKDNMLLEIEKLDKIRKQAIQDAKGDDVQEAKADLVFEENKLAILEKYIGKASDKLDIAKQENDIIEAKTKLLEKERKEREKSDNEALKIAKSKFDEITIDVDNSNILELENKLVSLTEVYIEKLNLIEDKNSEVAQKLSVEYLSSIKTITDEIEKIKDIDINVNVKGFDDITNGLASLVNSFSDLQKIAKDHEKQTKRLVKGSDEYNKVSLNTASNQIGAYANMTGAMGGFFTKNEQAQKKLMELQRVMFMAQMAMELQKQFAYGTTALAASLTLPPPASFAAFAATGAMLASLGIMVGGALSGSDKETVSYDAFSAKAENLGTGSVLGDTKAVSESIKNSLEVLEDYAQPQFAVLSEMNKSLKTLNERIGGMSSLLIRQGGFAFGEGFQGFDTGFKNNINLGIEGLLSKIPVIGDLFGGIIGSVMGGLFGKKSVSQSITDYGINFNKVLLTEAINAINGEAFQTVLTTTTKKTWFSKSTSHSYNTYFKDLDDEIERQFSLVLSNLYNTTLLTGQALDTNIDQIKNSLSNFQVEIGKISTKGKTGAEIQEQISNIFGAIGDNIALTAFPALQAFQQIGEGLFETMTRVGTGMEVAKYYIKRLGYAFENIKYTEIENKQGDVALEALAQSIKKLDEAVYGANNGVVQMIDKFSGTAEELYSMYTTFEDLRIQLENVNQNARSLTSSMILGAGSIEKLKGGLDDYFENFLTAEQRLRAETQAMIQEFDKLSLVLPTGKDGFISLVESIDTTTESGQELYGRLITLSDSFAQLEKNAKKLLDSQVANELAMAELQRKLTEEQEDLLKSAIDRVKTLSDAFTDMGESLEKTISNLLGNVNKGQSQDRLIKEFWEKRSEIDKYLAKDGDLTQSESDRLQKLIGDISSLSRDIQSSQSGDNANITTNLVNELSGLTDSLDFDNKILQTQIVDAGGNVIEVAEEKGAISSLVEQLTKYNKAIESQFKLDKELTFDDFKDGGLLSTADEIAFRQSFVAESATTFNEELENLRTSLSYLSLSTTDASKYLEDLSKSDSTTFKNIKETMATLGDNRFLDIFNKIDRESNIIKLPSFAVGTSNVPYDMIAQIHQREMIIPATFAESIRQGQMTLGGGSNSMDNGIIRQELRLMNDKLGKVIAIQNRQLTTQRQQLGILSET